MAVTQVCGESSVQVFVLAGFSLTSDSSHENSGTCEREGRQVKNLIHGIGSVFTYKSYDMQTMPYYDLLNYSVCQGFKLRKR